MIVIADTSPLQYAVEIGVEPAIFILYWRIVIPSAVSAEIHHPGAPSRLRRWVEDNHDSIEVRSVEMPNDPVLALLDPGEREAIALAQLTPGALLIIDDGHGRSEARRRGIRITGLLGVIREAALRGYLDFDAALLKLKRTDFRLSPEVEALVRRQYRDQLG